MPAHFGRSNKQIIQLQQLPEAAYVHIPFCRRRCFYCDFPIYVVGDGAIQNHQIAAHPMSAKASETRSATSQTQQLIAQPRSSTDRITTYLEALHTEIKRTPRQNQHPLQTVFFGGGTPSILTGKQLGEILRVLDEQFGLAPQAEISMEIDPGTFDLPALQNYKTAGINRFSFGIQAFQTELLSACGRAHTINDIAQSMALLKQANIQNYSLDLISGLPHQTMEQWEESLNQAIAYKPSHISTYDLTIESGTVFGKRYRPGDRPLPSDETTAQMYRLAHKTFTAAGYEHYEVSNYAQPGYQCQHNRTYWQNQSFYGFGMGATSYLNGQRFARPRKLSQYCEWVTEFDSIPAIETADPDDLLLDTLMVGLRLAEGVAVDRLRALFSDQQLQQVWKCLKPYIKSGWVEAIDDQANYLTPDNDWASVKHIRLSAPEGFLFSNVVLVKLFDQFGT